MTVRKSGRGTTVLTIRKNTDALSVGATKSMQRTGSAVGVGGLWNLIRVKKQIGGHMLKMTTIVCSVCGKERKVRQVNQHRTDLCKRCSAKQSAKRAWNPHPKRKSTYPGATKAKRKSCAMCSEPHTTLTESGVMLCNVHAEMFYSYKNTINSRNGVRDELLTMGV